MTALAPMFYNKYFFVAKALGDFFMRLQQWYKLLFENTGSSLYM